MFDFIYDCLGFKKKKEKVRWYVGDEELITKKKDDSL